MKSSKLFRQILSNQQNVRFNDLEKLVKAFGFTHVRTSGSHRIYARQGIPELVNLQEVGGQAKPYQIKQFLKLVEKYSIVIQHEEGQ